MGYYAERLSGHRLKQCYDLAPPRVRQYLEAELRFVSAHIAAGEDVLELGCGYGRVAIELARSAGRVVGIDTARASLALARELAGSAARCVFARMDAGRMGLPDAGFDRVVCIQNGISAFGLDPIVLFREALRVTRPGGLALFSSYSDRFWPHRLEWFRIQAAAGLVGELDESATADGVIVCRDGFRSGTVRRAEFEALCASVGCSGTLSEVDGSSLFCVCTVAAVT